VSGVLRYYQPGPSRGACWLAEINLQKTVKILHDISE
jgi:hypothetical protein